MSGSSGGGGSSTTTQSSEPWLKQKPKLEDIYNRAKGQSQSKIKYYPDETVAPFSPETEQALSMQTSRAQEGSPLVGMSQGEVGKVLGGDYLEAGNPYFSQMSDRIRGQVQPQIDARFATAGAAGSPLANRALGLGLGDAIGGLAYQNYGDERQRMIQGAALAPELANQDYYDIAKLAEVGAQRENLSQDQINAAMQKWQFEQMEPWQRLALYSNLVTGNVGGTTTIEMDGAGGRSPVGSGLTGALGGGASGAGVGSMFGGYGTAIGGGIGAGLGALSGIFQ